MRRLSVVAVVFLLGCPGTASNPDGGSGGGSGGSGGGTAGGAGGGSGGGSAGGTAGSGACLAEGLLNSLGKSKLLVGAQMEDTTAAKAPFGLHYVYLSAGVADGAGPCASCASNCSARGHSCTNASGGCGWWGCYQYDQDPPGAYVRDFITKAKALGQVPMFTYYELLHSSGGAEGAAEVAATNDAALMGRYFNDYRFMLQQIGQDTALIHLEPDLWGYGQYSNGDPHQIASAVASANPTDCGSLENSFAGFGQCLVAMTRKYAPHAKVGLHASAWATKIDVSANSNPGFDVPGEARKVAAFLTGCGAATGDFIVVEASDRDAGWYQVMGKMSWWDDTNATLPNFHQAFAWTRAVAEALNRPALWWQLPVGNMTQPNSSKQWKDNRLDYFFAHPTEVAAAHGAAFAFGAGEPDQTNPESDGDHLVNQVKAYAAAGGQAPCP